MSPENAYGSLCGGGRRLAVPDPIDHTNQCAKGNGLDDALVAVFVVLQQFQRVRSPVDGKRKKRVAFHSIGGVDGYRSHFLIVTVVPSPLETISNSSLRRLVPGNPSPRLRRVEYPSCNAREISGIPGPSSWAMISIPCLLTF